MTEPFRDDDLTLFATEGPPPLPPGREITVQRAGVRLWFWTAGSGPAVLLLHGGMGNATNFGHQVPALLASGFQVVAMDSRGHGRSSWDGGDFFYAEMAQDALAGLDALGVAKIAVVGWSDGAVTGLELARAAPERVAGVLFFACNVEASGSWPFEMTPTIGNCLTRHQADYARLSPAPSRFEAMSRKLQAMQGSQPDYSAADLGAICVPVTVAVAERDEFIRPEHGAYIARTIPGARLVDMAGVSHFAPVQRPEVFNGVVLGFLGGLRTSGTEVPPAR